MEIPCCEIMQILAGSIRGIEHRKQRLECGTSCEHENREVTDSGNSEGLGTCILTGSHCCYFCHYCTE